MITSFFVFLGFITACVLIALCFQFAPKFANKSNLLPQQIVDRFNKLVKSISPRNIDTIKSELFILLKQYKHLKEEEFSDALYKIRSSIKSLQDSKASVWTNIGELKNQIRAAKSSASPSIGASLVYQLEGFEKMYQDLENKVNEMRQKEATLQAKLNKFNADYALKHAQITLLTCNASILNNFSTIDIKIDDLVTEFNEEVMKASTRQEVHEAIHGKGEETAAYDEAAYIEKFNNFE